MPPSTDPTEVPQADKDATIRTQVRQQVSQIVQAEAQLPQRKEQIKKQLESDQVKAAFASQQAVYDALVAKL